MIYQRRTDSQAWCAAPRASVGAFVEHAYQEAFAIIEENKSVVIALVHALIDHPDWTLNSDEINASIVRALALKALADKMERRARWVGVEKTWPAFRPDWIAHLSERAGGRLPSDNIALRLQCSSIR